MQGLEHECNEDLEEQRINEEYKIWKKNSPFLYDTVITHVLDWPSLTVEWLSGKEVTSSADYSEQRIVIGTHTSKSEQEKLIIAKVKLPLEDSLVSGKVYLDNTKDVGGIGLLAKTENKIEPHVQINHEGEVNKARVMPQHDNIIATKSPNGMTYIYDYHKHPMRSTLPPQSTLIGHTREGYGLDWSPVAEGYLASGAEDHVVCVWNIAGASQQSLTIDPLRTLRAHSNIVEDVSWSSFDGNLLASVGDDNKLILWDMRADGPTHIIDAHGQEVNSVDFNKRSDVLLATSSSDRTVAIWDIRNLNLKMASLEHHKDDIYTVRWAPFNATMLASASTDRRICIWDLSRLGQEQSEEDAEDGPPELLFIHGGHTSKVSDFSWNPNDELVIASVAEDNILQVWQMSYAMLTSDDLRELPDDAMEVESN
jgi:histone-binding protein RBBP4